MSAALLAGCATSNNQHAQANRDTVRHEGNYRGSYQHRSDTESMARGKHAEALGWSRDEYYLHPSR